MQLELQGEEGKNEEQPLPSSLNEDKRHMPKEVSVDCDDYDSKIPEKFHREGSSVRA